MSQQSPLNVITLPSTIEELEKRVETTLEYYNSHLPAFIAIEMPDTPLHGESTSAYKTQLENVFNIIQVNGLPNFQNFSFEEILFDPQNLEEYLSRSCILECSIVHALVTGIIDQETYNAEGVQLICGIYIPLLFGAPEKGMIALYSPDC